MNEREMFLKRAALKEQAAIIFRHESEQKELEAKQLRELAAFYPEDPKS